jgi:cobalt-zinc-cadmium efflux system outer membrane protein
MLRLDEALALALQHNWDLGAARTDVAVAKAGERTAHEWPNPALSVTTTHVHADGGDATRQGDTFWTRSYDSVAQLAQTLDLANQRSARSHEARAATQGARARLADTRRTIVASTVRAYAAAALAEANARIAEDSAGYLRDEARIADVRWHAGDLSRSDLDQIQIAAARLELDARSARAAALNERLGLEQVIGLPAPSGEVALADSLEALAQGALTSPDSAVQGVRPDLAAARADLARTAADARLQRALRIPAPTLAIQAEHVPPDRPNTVGAGVALTLPFWNRNAGAIASADAQHEAAAREVRRVAALVAADLVAARASFQEAAQRWRRYRDELRPRSDSIRRAVSLAYEKGGASLVDLLQAQRNDNDVRLEAMRAANDVTVAAADLKAATTTASPEDSRP